MAITCGFFNSLEGDRKYDARQMGEMFDGLIMDGVFMSIGDALKTTPSSGMTVAVGTGRAWFLHTWTKNDSEYLIEVSAAESVLNRIDTIVLDVDNTEAVRSNMIKLIKGTPASNAKRPSLINTTDHKQIPLADILVPAGATTLATTNITNIVGTSECPYVTGPLSIIQNDDILAAWQEEFDTWFEGVKGSLDEDTAGNLYNLIQQKVDKTSVLDTMDEVNLATEEGLVAGALALKELNGKKIQLEEVYAATGLKKNLLANQSSSNLFSQSVDASGYAYIDVYTIFPSGNNRKMISIYKNGSEIKRYDNASGTSAISSRVSVSAFIPVSTGDTITARLLCSAGGIATCDTRIMAFYKGGMSHEYERHRY